MEFSFWQTSWILVLKKNPFILTIFDRDIEYLEFEFKSLHCKFSLNRDLCFESTYISNWNFGAKIQISANLHKNPILVPKMCHLPHCDGILDMDGLNWMKSAFFCGDDTIENVVKLAIMPLSLWGHSLCRCLLNQLMMELVRPSASCRRHPSVSTTKERERAALSIHEMES